MQANTNQVISVNPSFGGTNSAFTSVKKTQPETNTHLIRIRKQRTTAFSGIRRLFCSNKTHCEST